MNEVATQTELAQRWLHGYCERSGVVQSAMVLLGAGPALQQAAHWPVAATASAALLSAARAALKRGRALTLTTSVSARAGFEPGRNLSLPQTTAVSAQVTLADQLVDAASALPNPIQLASLKSEPRPSGTPSPKRS